MQQQNGNNPRRKLAARHGGKRPAAAGRGVEGSWRDATGRLRRSRLIRRRSTPGGQRSLLEDMVVTAGEPGARRKAKEISKHGDGQRWTSGFQTCQG